MALDSYSNLKAAVVRLDGSNKITDILDDCIDLCEAEIYANQTEPLRIRAMEARATATADTSSRFAELPTSFLQMRRLQLFSGGAAYDIKYRTPETLEICSSAGRPKEFTVTSQIEFDRVPDSAYTYESQYYYKLTALSSSNTSNSILTNFPNIYLYGVLKHVNMFNGEEDKAATFDNLFIQAIQGANKQDRKGRHGPAARLKLEGRIP